MACANIPGQNAIVAIPAVARSATADGRARIGVLVEGADFYSDPIVSPDGKFLAWLQWHHPNMPWDGTELWVAMFKPDGSHRRRASMSPAARSESIFQPEWSTDSALYFVSDRTGWWNLYRWRGADVEAVHPMEAEFGKPQWTFSMVTYAFVDARRIAATYTEGGRWKLALIDVERRTFEPIDLPVRAARVDQGERGTAIYFIGGSPTESPAIVR